MFLVPAGEIPFKALGCYRDNHNLYRPLPDQLFSDSQETIDFKDWPNYLSDAICRLANKQPDRSLKEVQLRRARTYNKPKTKHRMKKDRFATISTDKLKKRKCAKRQSIIAVT